VFVALVVVVALGVVEAGLAVPVRLVAGSAGAGEAEVWRVFDPHAPLASASARQTTITTERTGVVGQRAGMVNDEVVAS